MDELSRRMKKARISAVHDCASMSSRFDRVQPADLRRIPWAGSRRIPASIDWIAVLDGMLMVFAIALLAAMFWGALAS